MILDSYVLKYNSYKYVEYIINDHSLQLHLSELKCQQDQERRTEARSSRPMSAKIFDRMKESKLYDLPRGINVLVYPNGEHLSRALGVVVSSMTEVR